MAFTLAHMAAVLPFYRAKRWLSFEALLIGSMLPDLPYFLAQPNFVVSHQWIGLFSYCLPWGLGVFVLWYWLLKPALIALLQPWFTVSLAMPAGHFMQWPGCMLRVLLGLLLGASTHLLWDGITHPDGFIARHSDWLQQPVSFQHAVPVAHVLQYVSSVLGLGCLGWFMQAQAKKIAGQNRSAASPPVAQFKQLRFKQWQAKQLPLKQWHSLLILFLMCAVSLFWGLQALLKWHNVWAGNSYMILAKVLVGLLQGAGGVVIVYALAYQILFWFNASRQRKQQDSP